MISFLFFLQHYIFLGELFIWDLRRFQHIKKNIFILLDTFCKYMDDCITVLYIQYIFLDYYCVRKAEKIYRVFLNGTQHLQRVQVETKISRNYYVPFFKAFGFQGAVLEFSYKISIMIETKTGNKRSSKMRSLLYECPKYFITI